MLARTLLLSVLAATALASAEPAQPAELVGRQDGSGASCQPVCPALGKITTDPKTYCPADVVSGLSSCLTCLQGLPAPNQTAIDEIKNVQSLQSKNCKDGKPSAASKTLISAGAAVVAVVAGAMVL
ncbi:uncharacterized protein LOC62_02G002657 [Vanrija pseudolonga]|uniref:Uncharacterized protein n=1 Tax=Vanrija pseudolonga TaxID=143232 RepID=A0AAF1BG35_9TREE|nr:hypothetical protein LOC62_02G002657 [Vanrija pseudolonga]